MKHRLLYILPIILLSISSCEDNRLEGMVPDTLYIVQAGVEDVFVNKKDYADFTISVYKSGIVDVSASAQIVVDSEMVDKYNAQNGTSFELLPDVCYTISKTNFELSPSTVYRNSTITFDGTILSKYQSVGVKKYILPIKLVSNNDGIEVQEKRDAVLLIPVLE